MPETIIITGANGFIGSYLAKYFSEKKYHVICVSRKYFTEVKKQLHDCELLEMDVMSDDFKNLQIQADNMIHLASANDIVSKNFQNGVELSLIGTKNAIDVCVKNNIPQFIFFSTMQVYESELNGNYDEQTISKPVNDYAFNHLIAEEYVAMASKKNGLKASSVRPSNVYGAMMDAQIERWSLVPNCFIKEAIEKNNITLLSSGKQLRNFISLQNVAKSTEAILNNLSIDYQLYNIASENNFSIVEVAKFTQEVFASEFNRQVELVVKSDKLNAADSFHISIEKIKNLGVENVDDENAIKTEIKKIIELLK